MVKEVHVRLTRAVITTGPRPLGFAVCLTPSHGKVYTTMTNEFQGISSKNTDSWQFLKNEFPITKTVPDHYLDKIVENIKLH